jgi:glycosyltransferase involved in cell wall biosynthesis
MGNAIRRMKLVLATHVYPPNSHSPADIPGNFLPPLVAELVQRGAQVHVLAPDVRGEKVVDPNAPVTWFEWHGVGRNLGRFDPLNPLDLLRLLSLYERGRTELRSLVRRQGADAVFACWAVPSGVFAQAARRALGTPYAVWGLGTDIHTSPRNPLLRPLVVSSLRGASLRYANSTTLAHQVERLSGMSCGFLPTARRLPDAPPVDLPRDRVNFMYAGRLEPVKGVDILLNAFAQLSGQNVRAHLYLAGSGTQEKPLRRQVKALGLDDTVTFLGFLSEGPLASYLRTVDAVVIPSRAEAVPVVFTEAARFGTPAVATDVGDLGALARQYQTALVVDPENAAALAQGLYAMACGDRTKFRKGMPQLLERFDTGRAAEKLLSDLECMLSHPEGSRP